MVMSIEDAKKKFRDEVNGETDIDTVYAKFDKIINQVDPLNVTLPKDLLSWLLSDKVVDRPLLDILNAAESHYPEVPDLNLLGSAYSAYKEMTSNDDGKVRQAMVAAWYLGSTKFYATYTVPGTDTLQYALITEGKLSWVSDKKDATPLNRVDLQELNLTKCNLIPVESLVLQNA